MNALARLSDALLRKKVINKDQQKAMMSEMKAANGALSMTAVITKHAAIPREKLIGLIGQTFKLPPVSKNLAEHEIPTELLELIPMPLARKHIVIPIEKAANTLILAMADPTNLTAIDDISHSTGFQIQAVVALDDDILNAIKIHYKGIVKTNEIDMDNIEGYDDSGIVVDNMADGEADATIGNAVIKLASYLLTDSVKRGASDIHVEPYEKICRVRYRIDGVLHEIMRVPTEHQTGLVARLKVMARMRIEEKRAPQDGRIKISIKGIGTIDYRVNTLPTLFGEKIVLRLLDASNLQLDMTKLGFEERALKKFKHGIHQPFGMVLVTGPTGSGKTVTLYSALGELNQVTENLSTAEDPVEYNLEGINQVNVNPDAGLGFPEALRAFLRQDPDVIMIGEIRDYEVGSIAIKAALTGHLVISTLHTNSAAETITRMIDMGLEKFNLASALNVIIAQRLARRLCASCKIPDTSLKPESLVELGIPARFTNMVKPMTIKGCSRCDQSGYKGRVGLYEVLEMSDALKQMILGGANAADLKIAAMKLGMKTLRQSALTKLAEGVIDIPEVVRNTVSDTK